MESRPIELHTERLILRPFRLSDVNDVFEFCNSEGCGLYLGWPQPYTLKDAEVFVAKRILSEPSKDAEFVMVLNGKVIGYVALELDLPRGRAELGYALGSDYWGHGYATEGVIAIIDWAFVSLTLAKIWARAELTNERSWKLMERIGMQREGLFRSHGLSQAFPGQRKDEVFYGILRSEWDRRRAMQS